MSLSNIDEVPTPSSPNDKQRDGFSHLEWFVKVSWTMES